jgi:hypothetical protein
MANEKPKGMAFYFGRSLQAIGATICFLAMFKFATLMVESSKHFGDFTNFEQRVRDESSQFVSVFPQFFIGMAIGLVGSSLTYERDAAMRAGRTTINAKNIINAGGHVSNVAGDSISGHVTNSITKLQVSGDPSARHLADLLRRLQTAIETDSSLRDVDKTEALEQVKSLSEANKNPQIAKIAIRTLRGMMAELPTAVTFLEACNKLLPMIAKLIGLG